MGVTPVTDEEWHHTVTTYDGSILRVYLDGEMEAEIPASGEPDKTDAPLGIGSSCPGQFMKGIIDEACVMKVAMEEQDINQMMNGLTQYISVQFYVTLTTTWARIKK